MLGGPNLQQHSVEFKDGTGVKQDGVVVNSGAGPWTWTVPDNVRLLIISGCGGGAGGTGGTNNATSTGGGGGGGAAQSFQDVPLFVTPGASLTVTLGAAGTGGTPTTGATNGGNTTIAGVYFSPWNEGTTMTLYGGGANTTTRTDGNGQDGGTGAGNSASGLVLKAGGAGTVAAATPANAGGLARAFVPMDIFPGMGSTGGGGASTTAATAGANGGVDTRANQIGTIIGNTLGLTQIVGGTGNSTGTVSRGGGGNGGFSSFGYGGTGGNGGVNGGNATGAGAGGGGGGGGANGGNGTPGYLFFSYWSAD
jgi:hypothetical protein